MRCIAFALLALILVSGQPASAQSATVFGHWSGLGLQVGEGASETWTISLALHADGSGQIDYPTLHCGGALTLERESGGVALYREHITYGMHCVDNGQIGVFEQSGRLMWFWTGEGTAYPGMSASAVLSPAAPIS